MAKAFRGPPDEQTIFFLNLKAKQFTRQTRSILNLTTAY